MGKLLSVLGIPEEKQSKLPEVIFKGEKVVDALQRVYAKAPESPKKEILAKTISESVRLLLIQAQPYLIEEKKETKTKEENKNLPQEHELPQPPEPTHTEPQPPQTHQKPPKKKSTPPSQPQPPQTQPQPPEPPEPPQEEPMSCEEIKDTIKGLTLFAKAGDSEAKQIIQELKIKLKNQNCK
jgi:hypothetical protein